MPLNKVLLARQEHIDQLGHAIYGRDSEIKKLKSQRDDLLEALKIVMSNNEWLTGETAARAAIAKSEGV